MIPQKTPDGHRAALFWFVGWVLMAFLLGLIVGQTRSAPAMRDAAVEVSQSTSAPTARNWGFRSRIARPIAVSPEQPAEPANPQLLSVGQTNSPSTLEQQIQDNNATFRLNAASEARRLQYEPMFARLGLSPAQQQDVLSRLTELHKGAIGAGDSMLELLLARDKYDTEMRGLLGETGYQQYREFEAARPYVREVENLSAFARMRGIEIDQQSASRLTEIFQQAGLSTAESWDGPYDPAPRPIVGAEKVVADNQACIDLINSKLPEVLDRVGIQVSGFTALLGDYFSDRLEHYAEANRAAMMTPEERLQLLEQIAMQEEAKNQSKAQGSQ